MSSTPGTEQAAGCSKAPPRSGKTYVSSDGPHGICHNVHKPKLESDRDSACLDADPVFVASSDTKYSFLTILQAVVDSTIQAHVGLSSFIRLACSPVPRTVHHGPRESVDLWPCPPPLWRWTGVQQPSPRKRQRKRYHILKNQIIQQIVCVLNWEALGHPTKPPPAAVAGFGYSLAQIQMLERLEGLVDHFATAGAFDASDLGRCAEKLAAMLAACKELPVSSLRFVDLHEFVSTAVCKHVDPYSESGTKGKPPNRTNKYNDQNGDLGDKSTSHTLHPKAKPTGSHAKPVIAERIKWEYGPSFDPNPFLTDPVVKAAFNDPDTMKLPQQMWKNCLPGKVHCSRTEVLKLAKKWDAKGACALFPCHEINENEAVGIFAVEKDATYDRLILNPVVVNGRMRPYSNYTKSLAPGSLVSLVQLKNSEVLRISADDLSEFYYTFAVPPKRARRNALRMKFSPAELKDLTCFNPEVHVGPCFIALSALAMGDSLAVEIAQQAHHQVLAQLGGSMREHERVAYRKPFPRGDFFELLAIDDHVGIQKLPLTDFKKGKRARDDEVFAGAEAAYAQVGLVQHPRKRRRHAQHGIFLGAEIDGNLGRVSAPRHRIGLLMLCTSIVARRGTCTPKLLSSILGSWINILMYRRPILSILDAVFHEGHHVHQNQVFDLTRKARNELLALSILGPLCQTDLRTSTCPEIFCMDASPYGGGIVSAHESPELVSELWRHTEQRGFYTRLSSPASAVLQELGIEPEPVFGAAPVDPIGFLKVPTPERKLREPLLFDCIELFKGESNWSSSHARIGLRVRPAINEKGQAFTHDDLLNDSVFDQLVQLAARGVIREWHAGPPSFTFGTFRRPRLRSRQKPFGFNHADPLTCKQNRVAVRTAFLLQLAISAGCFVSVEQPANSVLFLLDSFQKLALNGCVISKFCFCSFGSAIKKPSKWLHNKPWMLELESKCNCKHPHIIVQGTFTSASIVEFDRSCKPNAETVYGRMPSMGESVASFSALYPIPFCRRAARGSLEHKEGSAIVIPLSYRIATFKALNLSCDFPLSGDADAVHESSSTASRPWHEDPEWIGELVDSLNFREKIRYKFKKGGHINVLECRVFKTWIKQCAKQYPKHRILGLLDSRVTLGATAKGRSSSESITRVLQGSLGYILGGCLYPGGLHVCSSKNRGDGPSRNRPMPGPSKEAPFWLQQLRKGKHEAFDAVLASAQFTRNAARWLRLLLLLGGDIERNPGPKTILPRTNRCPLDDMSGFAPATSRRMAECWAGFKMRASETLDVPLADMLRHPHALALALRGYGLYLHENGYPRYLLVYAITSAQNYFPQYRNMLSPAWQVDKKWQLTEPGECRPVISAPILRAMTSLALIWKWDCWLAITLIAFSAMLHPAEFLSLTRRDLVLPSDAMISQLVMYVHVQNPKTARFARRQHCRIDDPWVIKFAIAVFGNLPLDCKLFLGSTTSYRSHWDAVLRRLGVPCLRKDRGATPGSLRGSGATHLYLATEDVQKVQWRGRWSRLKTVEFYLQEVAAQLLLHNLSHLARERVRILGQFSVALLSWRVSELSSSNKETEGDHLV